MLNVKNLSKSLKPDGVPAKWKLEWCSSTGEENCTPKKLGERKTARDEVCLLTSGNFAVKNGFFWVLGFVHHFPPVAMVYSFLCTWISVLHQNVLISAVFGVESSLETT